MTRSRVGAATASLLLLSVLVSARGTVAAAAPDGTVVVDGHRRHQVVDGFGFSEAFQRSNILHGSQGLSPANQRRALDLLFSVRDGAGFSILRNGIGSSPDSSSDHMASIAPVSPGSPSAPPRYVWDRDDNSQVWLSQQAMAYGVRQIYADAWSAPGYMKTNGSDSNGGMLCGVPGTSCPTGDWRQAYADYLVQYLRFYAQEGVPITHLGFLNEPEIAPTYASMISSGAQAADVLKVLGPTLDRAGLRTEIACCDAVGWDQQAAMLAELRADPQAMRHLDLVTGHGYASPPDQPLDTDRHVWQSEWANFDPWDPTWDSGTPAAGMVWAQRIQTALVDGEVNAFFHWWGASASTANSGMIRLVGDSIEVSKRLWAFAQFSRFVRPGAVRIGASGGSDGVTASAFENTDGSTAIQLINAGQGAVTQRVRVAGVGTGRGGVRAFLTDATHDVAALPRIPLRGGGFTATVPPRAIVTYVLAGTGR